MWSYDNGETWKKEARGPRFKTIIELSTGEIMEFGVSSTKRSDGLFTIGQARSTNNWQTYNWVTALFDTPQAIGLVNDSCEAEPDAGLAMQHGILELSNGNLIATMYGRYADDTDFTVGYPTPCYDRQGNVGVHPYKTRTVVVFSEDRGLTWGSPVVVGNDTMEDPTTGATVPVVAREGFNESDLAFAPNGDLLMVMRTGGNNISYPGPQTPIYVARSKDYGKTWTECCLESRWIHTCGCHGPHHS